MELRTAFASADALDGLAGGVAGSPNVLRTEVGQFVLFPVAPQVFDGVELRGVGGEPFDVQPVGLGWQAGGDEFAAVDGRAVPQQ